MFREWLRDTSDLHIERPRKLMRLADGITAATLAGPPATALACAPWPPAPMRLWAAMVQDADPAPPPSPGGSGGAGADPAKTLKPAPSPDPHAILPSKRSAVSSTHSRSETSVSASCWIVYSPWTPRLRHASSLSRMEF